jgi:hypothetical protein
LIEETVEQNSFNEDNYLNIHINDIGEVSVNGTVTSLEELDPLLEELKNKNGVVHYFRAKDYEGDVWEQVLDIVTKYELPLAFFTDETFTEKVEF